MNSFSNELVLNFYLYLFYLLHHLLYQFLVQKLCNCNLEWKFNLLNCLKFFFPFLYFTDRNIPPCYACLKEERDVWLLFLNEMTAAHKSSIAMRDPKMVDLAVNNVLVARALLEMNVPPKTVEGRFEQQI